VKEMLESFDKNQGGLYAPLERMDAETIDALRAKLTAAKVEAGQLRIVVEHERTLRESCEIALTTSQEKNASLLDILRRYSVLSDKSAGDAWCAIRELPGATKWLKDLRTALGSEKFEKGGA
jgi:hypothetical protein